MTSISIACVDKLFHLHSSLYGNGSRDRSCQHLWFSEFDFIHHDIENKYCFATCFTGSYIGQPELILLKKNRKTKAKNKMLA